MTGSVRGQVKGLFRVSGVVQIGSSRHAAKQEARRNGARGSHDIARQTPITSINTIKQYTMVAEHILLHAKAEFGVRDIEKLTAEHVASFFQEEVISAGSKYGTFKAYASGAQKMLDTLERYNGQDYGDLRQAIADLRPAARAELDNTRESRQYKNPAALICALEYPGHRLIASLQLEGGGRFNEVNHLSGDQLKRLTTDHVTKETVGVITIRGGDAKGGRPRDIYVNRETYQELKEHFRTHDRFHIDYAPYLRDLKQAAEETDQDYNASHGLRHNFAQERFDECLSEGMGETEAKLTVALEMGHSRPSITDVYLEH